MIASNEFDFSGGGWKGGMERFWFQDAGNHAVTKPDADL
jgi:hypothetical protein